jgi:transposase
MGKKMRPRAYPAEFRHKLIQLARAGRKVDDLAAEFNVGYQTIRNWIKQDDLDNGRRGDGMTTSENEEVSRLRRRVKQLELEREILSKATAWSLGRPTSYRTSLRIRESASGRLPREHHVPRP